MKTKEEEIKKPSWTTLEMFLLEIVIDKLQEINGSNEPLLEEIDQAFNKVSSFSSLNDNNILINRKPEGEVSQLVKMIEKETVLFKHLVFGELEEKSI